MRVVVKGSVEQVYQACDARDIPISYCSFIYTKPTECCIHVSDSYRQVVAQWFGESMQAAKGSGFPPGTCLLYTTSPGSAKSLVMA